MLAAPSPGSFSEPRLYGKENSGLSTSEQCNVLCSDNSRFSSNNGQVTCTCLTSPENIVACSDVPVGSLAPRPASAVWVLLATIMSAALLALSA